jgi:hypothetical protein
MHSLFNPLPLPLLLSPRNVAAPMGDGDRSHMRDDPLFAAIAANHTGATASQVIMTWELMTGADILLPRSSNVTHQQQNVALYDDKGKLALQLSEWEVAAISSVKTYNKVYGESLSCVEEEGVREGADTIREYSHSAHHRLLSPSMRAATECQPWC